MQYVVECFNNSSLFHKALKEAFETFCNKSVGEMTSAELLASFCNTLLTKASPFCIFFWLADLHDIVWKGIYLCV